METGTVLTIGLIGGVASGKSTVGKLLAEHGAVVIDADKLAHESLEAPEIKTAIVERWGSDLLSVDGQVDRREVAAKVFGDSPAAIAERRFLEGLIHPEVRRRMQQRVAEHEAVGGRVAVLDVPLLLEVGWREDCDLVLMVDSPQSVRLARALARGWSEQDFYSREKSQLPISEKKAAADAFVKNTRGLDELREEVDRFWAAEVAPRLPVG